MSSDVSADDDQSPARQKDRLETIAMTSLAALGVSSAVVSALWPISMVTAATLAMAALIMNTIAVALQL